MIIRYTVWSKSANFFFWFFDFWFLIFWFLNFRFLVSCNLPNMAMCFLIRKFVRGLCNRKLPYKEICVTQNSHKFLNKVFPYKEIYFEFLIFDFWIFDFWFLNFWFLIFDFLIFWFCLFSASNGVALNGFDKNHSENLKSKSFFKKKKILSFISLINWQFFFKILKSLVL